MFGDVTLITSEFFYLLKTGFSQFSLYFCVFSGLLSWIISGSLNNFKRTPVVKERKTPPVKLAECGKKRNTNYLHRTGLLGLLGALLGLDKNSLGAARIDEIMK